MKKRLRLLAIFLFLLIPASALPSKFDGLWRSQGYGLALDIKGNNLKAYDITEVSLLLLGEIKFDENFPLSRSGDQLFLKDGDGTIITFDPIDIDKLPEINEPTHDPEINFEVFWHNFEENFALFPLTGVDWPSLYEQYRPQVTAHTTDEELFSILCEMIIPLNDGHTFIGADINGEYNGCGSGPVSNSAWIGKRSEEYVKVITSYLDKANTVRSYDGEDLLVLYGTINQSIGYLGIFAYEYYEESGDSQAEEAVFSSIVDEILAKFQNLEALIVDIKANDGGEDNLTVALANRLTDQKRLAFSKQARIGGYDDFAEPTDFHIEPDGIQFIGKPVALLISSETFSAGEVQALILDGLENVTLIGENTYGIFSNILDKLLPNGWVAELSNER